MKIILLLLVPFFYLSGFAQLKYPIVGTYKGRDAQGMAIYKDKAFLMSDGGYCRMYDLSLGKIVSEFPIGSFGNNPHVNNACFGVEKLGSSNCPVIYITECRKNGFRCFVESFDGNPRIVQTIDARKNRDMSGVLTWVVDTKKKCLYAITRSSKALDERGSVVNRITKYRLPQVSEGAYVMLTEKDEEDCFDVVFPNILQGCKIKGHFMYLVTGLQQSQCHFKDSQRAIQVIDLKKKKLKKTVDLTYVTTNEPEDIDFYKGKCLLYCGQEGGIYEIKL
jgi:hypothetical protein